MTSSTAAPAPQLRSTLRTIGSVRATLGEGLCWSPHDQALYWVDILERRLYRETIASGGHRAWDFDETISAVAERASGPGLAVALRRGLALFDPASGEIVQRLHEPEPERTNNRFNDGKCDAQGRFWGGTMDFDVVAPTGAYYRFDAQGHAERALDVNWIVTNGTTWSADGRTIFLNDTVHRRIVAHEFDMATGAIGAARDWLVFPPGHHPDGMTTDAAGRLWIAHWGGACVTCHDPQSAEELFRVDLPTDHITNVAFGGPQMTTLFISSARFELDAAQLAKQPLAGALFAVETNVAGHAANRFAG